MRERAPNPRIASQGFSPYFVIMIRRLLAHLGLLLAVLLAPFGMLGSGAAMAHMPQQAMAGHCEDMAPADDDGAAGRSIDCMMVCSALLPATGSDASRSLSPACESYLILAGRLYGTEPRLELPPPRLA